MNELKPPSPTDIFVENLSIELYQNVSKDEDFTVPIDNSITLVEALNLVIKYHEVKEEYEVCSRVLNFKNRIQIYD